MTDETSASRSWRATKSYEGQGPLILWQVVLREHGKLYLIADATQQHFGLRLSAAKPEGLKVDGAVVALLRKHARTGGVGPALRHEPSGDIWLPIGTTRGADADFWVQLAKTSPPEIRFIAADGTILVRKSSQGTYTKRRTLEGPLPPALPADSLVEMTTMLLAMIPVATRTGEESPAPDVATALPDFQKEARDRLARRLKTVRKAAAKRQGEKIQASRELAFGREAELLQDHLHQVEAGLSFTRIATDSGTVELELDPSLTPGQNLKAYFERAKKARRASVALGTQVEESAAHLDRLEADLAHLRQGPLGKAEVDRILASHRLAIERSVPQGGDGPSLPYRTYLFDGVLELRVGRSAEASDLMVKAAKANDYWVHAVGITGSHVMIPAKGFKGELPLGALRMAAILALHHSKARGDLRGEVYISRRQHVRKRKGMAPGLWQVDKAETMFCSYDNDELTQVMDRLRP